MKTIKSKLYEGKQRGASGGSGGGGDDVFNGARPISRQTPGIQGVNVGAATLKDFIEKVFFPAVAPLCNLSFNNPVREIGATTAYTLTWAVTKQSRNITGITVDGVIETPTGDTQTGTETGNVATASGQYVKSMAVTDGTLNANTNATLIYLPRMFWGTTVKDGTIAPILNADILALSNSDLRTDFLLSLTNFGGEATRLIFAFPANFGNPQFKVNGLNNTAFTKVRANSDFVNAQGATLQMDVWVSDNIYNSPLDSVTLI